VGFYITGYHINSLLFCHMSRFQHGVGFTYTSRISEKDFQMSFIPIFFIGLDCL
jgi:hypothetical protein